MNRLFTLFIIIFVFPLLAIVIEPAAIGYGSTALAQSGNSAGAQNFALDAERIVFFTNIQRRSNGLAPLKISRELTEAALDFAEDAVVNMDSNYCGHTDSTDRSVGDRLRDNGMVGMQMWGENVVCGYMAPQEAVDAWMASAGHRENILTAGFAEIGVGHFVDDATGYIVQNFAFDENASFVIINNESPSTTSQDVELYIYDHNVRSGMAGIGPAVEMMLSNNPTFAGASWQPFAIETSWTLDAGEGQRRVYVATRDADGRRAVRFDDIYLGASPTTELTLDSYPSIKTKLSREIITSQLPEVDNSDKVQLSMDWEICETDTNVQVYFGSTETVNDADAHGGTALKMAASSQQALVSLWTPEYVSGETMVGYVRLKVDNNQSSNEVLTVEVQGDETVYASVSIHATDFSTVGVYQDFPVRFTVPTDFKPALVKVHLKQQNSETVYFDGFTFYTDTMPFARNFRWLSTRPANRDRGLRIRTVARDGSVSDPYLIYPVLAVGTSVPSQPPADESEEEVPVETPVEDPESGETHPEPTPELDQSHVSVQAEQGSQVSITHRVGITCSNCPRPNWNVSSNVLWLSGNRVGDEVEISVNAANLPVGSHEANLVVTPSDSEAATPTEIVVFVTVTGTENDEQPGEPAVLQAVTDVIYLPITLK